jgi:hypothetical protein
MCEPDRQLESRSRAKFRRLAWEASVVCCLLAVCYEAVATLGNRPGPFILCLVAAAVFAFIGHALPDRGPPSDEMRDYDEGRHGTIRDGRGPSERFPR